MKRLDPEIKALRAVNRALNGLDAKTRHRLLTWRVNFEAGRADVVLPTFRDLPVVKQRSASPRRMHPSWIAAGRRRIVARGLRAEGKTFAQIGKELGVSHEQARRDCQ